MQHGYDVEDLRELIATEEAAQRVLILELETLKRPQEIESRATSELGLVAPSAGEFVIIERHRAATPAGAIVAEVR